MNSPQGPMAIVSNRDTGENFIVMQAMGRAMVMRGANSEADGPDLWWEQEISDTMTVVGPCSHLGEGGSEWTRPDEGGPQNACVTADGIILWASQNGRTTWETTSVQRGAQDASLFAPPPGAQVMDLGQRRAVPGAGPQATQGNR
mgnify:CR=1 FL=1